MKCLIVLLFVLLLPAGALSLPVEEAIYTNDYYLSIYPNYPPFIGEKITIRVRPLVPATKVTLYSDREQEIPMVYRDGYWWGKFQIPEDYKEGSHFFTVWIKYVRFRPTKLEPAWLKSVVWYKMLRKKAMPEMEPSPVEIPPLITLEAEEEIPVVTGEAVEITVPTVEVVPFIVKGSKTLSFSSKSIEGSKEGYVPGITRDESLRLNISGKSDDTEVDANLISTSTAGTTQVTQREDKVSVLIKKASTEAYLGDFTADLTETEFTKLNKVLSGVRIRGDYKKWGFNTLYSSPKGEAKLKRIYGDGTQGPYRLDFAPVVINSEQVYVDGILQKRGDDYTIDYQAGTVTFVKRTIDPKSILNIYYDYREILYQHATYGLRLTASPYSSLKIGATYLNDSDSLTGAAEIRQSITGEAVNPQSHYVFGADGSFVSEALTLNGEAAYSHRNLNLLSAGSEESGRAVKLDLASQLGPFGITARGKRVGAKFLSIAEATPKQDVTEYGGGLSFRPGSLFGAQGNYEYEKFLRSGIVYENRYKSAKAGLTPERLPSLEYHFYESDESNDPVTGSSIGRTKTHNSAETIFRFGFLSSSLKGTTEKWLVRSPSEEATDYKRVNFGLATLGLEKISFTSNLELEDRAEPSGAKPYRRTYNVNLSATPVKSFFVSTSIDYLDDSALGVKNATDLSYRVEPGESFRSEGKYTVTTLSEDYATAETVAKHAGSLSFDLRPSRYLRLRCLYKPNFTKILRTDSISYNNEQSQAEVNLIPLSDLILGVLYKVGHSFNIYKQDYPDYRIKDNTADTDSTLYTIKMAPFKIFSTEFNYLLENGSTTQRVTSEPLSYLPGRSFGKKFDASVKTSLTERFAVDSRYTYQRSTQGTGEGEANVVNSVSHTASLKGIWNISDSWSLSVSGAYVRAINNLSAIPVTYTYSPGCGFIYRQGEKLRVDFDYTYSKSYSGADTELSDYSLRVRYNLSDYVNVTLRAQREISRAPDYKLTDLSGNVEINL